MAASRPDPSDAPPRSGTTRAPVALVAGGSRGLGLIVARELSVRGFRTVICARDADEVARAVRLLAGWCQEVQGYVCDVADHRPSRTSSHGSAARSATSRSRCMSPA